MAIRMLKRKSAMTSRKVYRKKRRFGKKKSLMSVKNIRGVVNKVLKHKIETKQSTYTTTDGNQIFHNDFTVLESGSTFLSTTQGTQDPMTGVGQRVGDEITLKGISLKMMVELNERYSDVTHRLICVRSAKGDVPTRATLFAGVTGNKMIDNFNRERYSIMFTKTFKIVAPNQGTTGGGAIFLEGGAAGWNEANGSQTVLSRATRIIKVYIPGSKFAKNGLIKYENNSATQVKFFDYHLVLYAYSNLTTNQDIWYVSRVNDYVKTMYFTDA